MQTEFCSVGDWLFFDPTDPATPLGELPEVLYGTWALRASRPGSELIKLSSTEPENYYRKYQADAVLDSNGSFSAHITIKDFDLKSSQAEYLLKSSAINELYKRYQKYFASTIHNSRIECLHYECFDDSTLLSFTLKGDNQTTSAGGIIMLKPDFFHTLDNPEDMDEKRYYPITFGNPALYEKEIVWHLPENLVFERILDSMESDCAIAGFKCDITTSDSTLRYFMKTRYLGGQVPAESYEDGYEFINNLNKSQNRIVIIKTR
ncbi:MAG: hypothetical protein GF404_08830 [candidate division Zixibacteria bacterium]|nr:hypothetical protein [candidate division Zixibacteria bacterium]